MPKEFYRKQPEPATQNNEQLGTSQDSANDDSQNSDQSTSRAYRLEPVDEDFEDESRK
jgi:hypothetical protein